MIVRKTVSSLLACVLLGGALAGCSSGGKEAVNTPATSDKGAPETLTMPITQKPITIKWYQRNYVETELKSMGEMEAFKELEKRTGIHIEFVHPPNTPDALNVMLASGDYPDVVFWDWGTVPRGLTGLINDGIAIKLNDYMDKYAVNYKKTIDKNPDLKKIVTLDDGTYPAFFQLDPDPMRTSYNGLITRKDWLDKLGLKPPTTIDEWHTVLKAFKEKDPNGNGKADEIPYSIAKSPSGTALGGVGSGMSEFTAAWGILDGFYKDPASGKLLYGPMQPQYKDYLTTMASWYKEGLIDSEFASTDAKGLTTKLQNELVGTTYGSLGSIIGNTTTAARTKNPSFSLVGVKPPIGPGGKAYNYSASTIQKVGLSAIVTKSSKYPKEIVRLIDYMYSEEGQALLNWGIEGKSYVVKDGKKSYSEDIMKSKDGKSPQQAIYRYATPVFGHTKVMEYDAWSAISLPFPEQQESIKTFASADTSLNTTTSLSLTTDESSKLGSIMSDINTYKQETVLRIIMGADPVSKIDEFQKRLKSMGIDEANKIYQTAFDRFNARK
ncbi:extracellular solute-binding protein [Paenibacillus sp. LMG 31456]|uniref:Extracellular solute-binding protein n=1 Tax=Paenibacillus foliorum TaxID=2654974 RepID=A0A972K339_9BACL|nr:extracellular solute-binding protein [Paenibacillus foliorum]NOU98394.1 extracellular solute-binding protein [Paenibacillus foliorum]